MKTLITTALAFAALVSSTALSNAGTQVFFDDFKGGDHGVKQTSVDRWRTELSPFSIRTMDAMHRRAYEALGYEADHRQTMNNADAPS